MDDMKKKTYKTMERERTNESKSKLNKSYETKQKK